MARTAEITFKEFRRRYNTEDACRAELFRLRFPNGFVCPKCGCVEYYPVHGRNIYQCRSCRYQTSVTANSAPLFTRMKVVDNVQGKTLQEIIDQYFVPKTKVECDGYRSYLNLEGVELNTKKYETDDLHWVHKAISNLKAFLQGTYHGRCTKLQAYLDEYCFRFNRRMTGNQIFLRLTRAVATSCSVLS